MATENSWRASKIQAEQSELAIRVGMVPVSRCMPKILADRSQQQRWITFLRNLGEVITDMDFFVIPTLWFVLLYAWFAIDYGRRRIPHSNRTENANACWAIQRPREAFPMNELKSS